MVTGILDLEPSVESEMKKLHSQKVRQEKAEENARRAESAAELDRKINAAAAKSKAVRFKDSHEDSDQLADPEPESIDF